MAIPKKKVIFVLGGPGSGKGTVCSYISREYKIGHLSAGTLLRNERDNEGSQFNKIIRQHMENGTIVPSEITCMLLKNAMEREDKVDTILIDGFPRNKQNLESWQQNLEKATQLLFVLFLKADDDVLVERCLKRSEEAKRSDDNVETIRKRLKTFYEETMPLINYFMDQNLVRFLSTNMAKEEVYKIVRAIFDQSL